MIGLRVLRVLCAVGALSALVAGCGPEATVTNPCEVLPAGEVLAGRLGAPLIEDPIQIAPLSCEYSFGGDGGSGGGLVITLVLGPSGEPRVTVEVSDQLARHLGREPAEIARTVELLALAALADR